MGSPSRQLTHHYLALGDQLTPAGQHQVGDRFQVDRIGLDSPPACDAALLSDVGRVQLEHLPPGRPPIVQHRPVIVPSRLHTDPDPSRRCDNRATRCTVAASPERVIANSTGPNTCLRALSVAETIAEVLPTSTATTIVDDVTGAA
jgi:hypothetical protein